MCLHRFVDSIVHDLLGLLDFAVLSNLISSDHAFERVLLVHSWYSCYKTSLEIPLLTTCPPATSSTNIGANFHGLNMLQINS